MAPINWDAQACLPLHPRADLAPLQRYRAAGVDYGSINVGMDMNPVPQVLAVISGFRAKIAAQADRYVLARCVADIEATGGVVCISGVSIFVGSTAPTVRDVARHAAYVAALVGVEHAGIGLDLGFSQPGLADWGEGQLDTEYWWPRAAGYEGALVMGDNLARVARAVWRG